MTPDRIFPRVDLPAPFSPTRAWIDPRATRRLTASRARAAPKDLPMSLSSTCAPWRPGWSGTSAGPLGGELARVRLRDYAVVRQASDRVHAAAALAIPQGLDHRDHGQPALARRRLGDVPVPGAGCDALQRGGARAIADEDDLAGLVRGGQSLRAALDALVRAHDQVQAGVGLQHVLHGRQPHGRAEEALALGGDRDG